MDTVAILIAVVSLSIAMLTLGWTIYRDAIRKPRFRVSIGIRSIVQAGHEPKGPYIFVEALNMGPLPNRLSMPHVRKSWWQRRIKPDGSFAFIYPDFGHMATTPAGTRIEVGDKGTYVFPYDKDCFLKTDFVEVGVYDGYGRAHWSSRKGMQIVREQYRKDYVEGSDNENEYGEEAERQYGSTQA